MSPHCCNTRNWHTLCRHFQFVSSNFGNLCRPTAVYVVCVFVCVRACDAWMCVGGMRTWLYAYLHARTVGRPPMRTVSLIQLTHIAGREVCRQSQHVIRRLVLYWEPIVFGMFCLPVERLHINPENIATSTGQRMDVVIPQPELAARATEASLVFCPVAVELDRTVHTLLEHLMIARQTSMNVQWGGSSHDRGLE